MPAILAPPVVAPPVLAPPVLAVEQLSVSLHGSRGAMPVLENLSFSVAAGETLALVGESGCGKSISALALMGLLPPGFRRDSGHILLDGEDLAAATPGRLRALRGNRLSMIFQEPMTASNPLYTVGDQIAEALRLHAARRKAARARALATARGRADPGAGAAARRLSARALRRHAAAGDDRDGARLPSRSC